MVNSGGAGIDGPVKGYRLPTYHYLKNIKCGFLMVFSHFFDFSLIFYWRPCPELDSDDGIPTCGIRQSRRKRKKIIVWRKSNAVFVMVFSDFYGLIFF